MPDLLLQFSFLVMLLLFLLYKMFGCKKAMVSLKFVYNMKRKYPVPTYVSDRIFCLLSKIQEAGGTFLACLINVSLIRLSK